MRQVTPACALRTATDRGYAPMECTVHWVAASGMAFMAETGSGHTLTMDGAPDGGGRNLAPRPMEAVLAGAGGCSAYDVVLILKRGRHDVTGCTVKVSADRAAEDPKVFTRIHMHFVVSGRQLSEPAVARAVALSHEKYCSATIMLGKTAEVTTSHEVVPQ
jgi:putative redox protein